MAKASVTVLGGDLRGRYLAEYMESKGHEVTCFGVMTASDTEPFEEGRPLPGAMPPEKPFLLRNAASLEKAVAASGWILCPMPFSKDRKHLFTLDAAPAIDLEKLKDSLRPGQILVGGGIPELFSEACARRQVTVMDLMEDETLARANAALTAEGLLSMLIAQTPFSLVNRKLLILGFGRCGQEIAWLLSCFSTAVTVCEHDPERTALAARCGFLIFGAAQDAPIPQQGVSIPDAAQSASPASPLDYDIVINTVPAQVLTGQQLSQLPAHCMLFDIASAPFGFQLQAARETGLSLIRCPGIPGALMPQTAGELIAASISERMLSHGV